MRMKEVLARTGLTDRAVRFYMENGLIHPARTTSYTGRSTFTFTEDDVRALETVVTLRRAGFAIAEIAAMQADPGCIPGAIEARRDALVAEIAEREATYSALSRLEAGTLADVDALAAGLRATAPSNSIPKEDNGMTMKEIKRILRVRLAAVLALVAAVVGVVNLARLTYEGCFVQLLMGNADGAHGPHAGEVSFALHPLGDVLLAWLPAVLIAGGAVLLFGYIARGKAWLLLAAMACVVVGCALTFAMPAEIAQRMRFQEFMDFRFSFLYRYLRADTTEGSYTVGAAFKFVPFALSLGCAVWALVRERGES